MAYFFRPLAVVKRQQPPAISFPGMGPGERFQFYYRQHWLRLSRLLQTLVAGTLGYAGALWLASQMPDADTRRLLLALASVAYLFLQLGILARFYRYFLYVIVVTDSKVYRIKKTLVAVDDRQTIDLWSLSDVTVRQHGLFQNMFGFGTLVLHGNEELRIHFTPGIRDKLHRLSMLRAQARAAMIRPVPPAPGQTS
jgi:hypothetical protein